MLRLVRPEPEDMRFRERMLADPETMAYNHAWGGTIAFPETAWPAWYRQWVEAPEGRFYRLLREDTLDCFVGEVAWHTEDVSGRVLLDVLVYAPYRRRGYGRTGLRLLCEAAVARGIRRIEDDLAVDNPAVRLFQQEGFEETACTESIRTLVRSFPDGADARREDEGSMAENTRYGTFPDGTPISSWFADSRIPDARTLGRRYVLTEHGIEPGTEVRTQAIQQLIDRIAGEGGGLLVVPRGVFRTGALFFRPGVHLMLEQDAVLQGSDDISDYPVMDTRIEGESCRYFAALINAEHCDGLTILGPGTIDGNGFRFWKAFWLRRAWNPACTNKDEQRPRLIFISGSRDVTLAGVRMRNAAFWTCHLYRCRYVKILNCSMYSPFEPVKAPSTDAIDLDACEDVLVKGCSMHVNDDAVALKGGKGPWADRQAENGRNERIIVEDCHYGFCHGCLTLGSEAVHCRNIILRRITVDSGFNLLWLKMRPDTPQHYEYVLVEDVVGHVDSFLQIDRWNQFFDLKDRREIPLSYADHITMQRCMVDCGTCYRVQTDESQYLLSDFAFRELSVRADAAGNEAWAEEFSEDAQVFGAGCGLETAEVSDVVY